MLLLCLPEQLHPLHTKAMHGRTWHPVPEADGAGVPEPKASLAFCKGTQVALGSFSYLFYKFGFVYEHATMLMSPLPICEDQVRRGTFVGELYHNEIRNAKEQFLRPGGGQHGKPFSIS